MTKKIPLGIALAFVFVAVAVSVAITVTLTVRSVNSVIEGFPEREQMYDSLSEIDVLVRAEYYGEIDSDALDSGIAEAYIAALGDKYSRYMTADEYKEYLADSDIENTVKYEINGECGYIRISAFGNSTAQEFSAALDSLKSSEISKLILDLRDNSGGNIASAAAVTDLIVPLATEGSMSIATVTRSDGETVEIFTADADAFTCKAAVLTDEGTSGAAELVACDMRDYGFAVLVGQKTDGRGVMQKAFELKNGDAVLLSVGKITPYISESYDGAGLVPDIAVALSLKNPDFDSLEHDSDSQYAAALEYLLKN